MNVDADAKFESLITELMAKVKDTQMTEEEYRYIASFMGGKKVLVFGLGNDTPLWQYVNGDGTTVFLEHDKHWVSQAGNDVDVRLVEYNTHWSNWKILMENYFELGIGLEMELPDDIRNTLWDVVIVDSPVGFQQGRMKSIFEASKLTSGHVFVHDCNRDIEKAYCDAFLKPENFVKELTKLRHYAI